jgi:hypothetical protein
VPTSISEKASRAPNSGKRDTYRRYAEILEKFKELDRLFSLNDPENKSRKLRKLIKIQELDIYLINLEQNNIANKIEGTLIRKIIKLYYYIKLEF